MFKVKTILSPINVCAISSIVFEYFNFYLFRLRTVAYEKYSVFELFLWSKKGTATEKRFLYKGSGKQCEGADHGRYMCISFYS